MLSCVALSCVALSCLVLPGLVSLLVLSCLILCCVPCRNVSGLSVIPTLLFCLLNGCGLLSHYRSDFDIVKANEGKWVIVELDLG